MTNQNWTDLVTYHGEDSESYQEILNKIKWKDLVTFAPEINDTYQEVLNRINK